MSRTEAYAIIDRILDHGYCGDILIPCFKGTANAVKLVDQTIKSDNELIMVAA